MDAEVLPYHWDDREKFHADYEYLRDFHERLLQDLTVRLNAIHRVNHSLRYWRILIGPWLGYFVQVLFDRWSSIQLALGQYDVTGTIVVAGEEDPLVPNDMVDFTRAYLEDEWNHHEYAAILRQFTAVRCIEHVRDCAGRGCDTAPPRLSWKQRVRRTLVAGYARAARMLTRDADAFFIATYLPFFDEMQLYRRLGQVPLLWRSVAPVRAAVDSSQRQWVVPGASHSRFEECARTLIPQQMPTVYLEGYDRLAEQAHRMPWPKQPKLIWTSIAYSSDDVFKAWAGQKVEDGAPLVIGQHGGHYGVGRCSFVEDHEIAISDCYLTWGWTKSGEPKVRPLCQLKAQRPLDVRHAEQTGALLVTAVFPRQSVTMFSVAMARQWLDYFSDQCAFVEALPLHIRRALTVRLHDPDRGWDQHARWRDRFPALRLDEGRSNILDQIRRSRLYIATYNATTYLEAFTIDVPTVIYWKPEHWELRDSAVPYFEDLARVGIFHKSPESAARYVAHIWDDVDRWWTSPAVRGVLKQFKKRYCHLPENLLDSVEAALREVMAGTPR